MPSTTLPLYKGDYHGVFFYDFIKELNKKNVDITIITPSDSKAKDYEIRDGIKIKRFNYFFSKRFQKLAYGDGLAINLRNDPSLWFQVPFFNFFMFNSIRNEMKNYDLIHAHFGLSGLMSIIARFFSNKKIPIITSFYGKDIDLARKFLPLFKILFRKGDLFITLSKDMGKELESLGCKKEKIIPLNLGVNVNEFKYKKRTKKKKITILLIGRLIEKKGIKYAIEAVSKIKNVEFRILGDGYLEKELKNLAKKLNCDIKFISYKGIKDTRKLTVKEYYNADLFLLPSVVSKDGDKEGTPFVLMEAQSTGLCCISTFHAGIPEIVVNNKTGLLVREKDVNAIKEKLLYFNDYRKRVEFGKNGRKNIEKNFNQEKQVESFISCYKKVKK